MAPSPQPKTPLRILTIDGGGLQGITTLEVLGQLLKRESKITKRELRPCDMFDVIAGTGTGGWLALFLGRFQMSLSAAMDAWKLLLKCIKPDETSWLSYLPIKHNLYDTHKLVDLIDHLTDKYETGKHMFLPISESARCKHVFVSAIRTDGKGSHLRYSLFRTYDCPEAPVDPHMYLISHAFAATGATKYFTAPWEDPSAGRDKAEYQDIQFPFPHNTTGIALDEIERLYGPGTKISIIINVGPGIPNDADCQRIMGWGESEYQAKKRSSDSNNALSDQPNDEMKLAGAKAVLEAATIKTSIRERLRKTYTPASVPTYFHFGLGRSAAKCALNDTLCPEQCRLAMEPYLKNPVIRDEMDKVATWMANEPLYPALRALEEWQKK